MRNMEKVKSVEMGTDNKKVLIAQLTYDLPVLRARLGISQARLAEKVGISRQTYNSIETGKKEMPWTVFLALIAVFQNNEETRKMLGNVEKIKEALNSKVGY